MTTALVAPEGRQLTQARAASVQTYAKIASILLLLSIVAGGIGEFYVPSQLTVSADATATANNIIASNTLFRIGFASYLIEAMCDVALALVFYVLLRPVGKNLALLAAFFNLIATAVFGVAETFYFAPLLILGNVDYLKTFSPDQLNTLAMLSLKFYEYGAGLLMVFYGVALILRGYLIFQSGYLPKLLGALLVLGGLGFVAGNFALVLAPTYASDALRLPTVIAILSLALWLLIKGVDTEQWEKRVLESA